MQGKVKLKIKYEIVKSKMSRLQRKISNKSSGGNGNKQNMTNLQICATKCYFSSKRKLHKIKVI